MLFFQVSSGAERIIGKVSKIGIDEILLRMKEYFSSHLEELNNI
ncbi:MAG: hypothetical protein WC412_09175 [Candidatus Omnitrophota bacterium]